ncbi:hypothetical protein [Stieleria mannarensis]|uniref:hypothetical protein n=1 Tax=Stieleria mannarensis TaxID=2755585 RepID=UPI0016005304|nr:hypothetical protein [Rhodopirellula sp. JC639]
MPSKTEVIALPDTRPSRLNAPFNAPINGDSSPQDSGAGVLHHPVRPDGCGPNLPSPDSSWDGRSILGPSWQVPIGRTDVVSGARLTVLANYLQYVPGTVHLIVAGTTSSCRIIAWSDTSVTVDLPNLGLRQTMDAVIRVVRPDGRVAKTVPVNLIPAPTVIMHRWDAVHRVSQTLGAGITAAAGIYAD